MFCSAFSCPGFHCSSCLVGLATDTQVGSVCYSIVSEVSARRLLIKSINLGRGLYCLLGIVKGTITPYMLNPYVHSIAATYQNPKFGT